MIEIYNLIPNSIYAIFLLSIGVGVIGSLIVINKSSFIAGSIAHGSFGGIGIAFYFGFPVLLSTSLFGVFLAIILAFITLKLPHRNDAVIGALWAIGMSIGIVFSELTPGYNGGLISYLFGNILTISDTNIYMMIGVDIVCLFFVVLFYNQILLMIYDKEFGKIKGINITFLHTLLMVLISLTIVMSVRAIGIILIIALFTIPPFIAEKWTSSLKSMMFLSFVLSCIFMFSGIWISFYCNISATAMIVLIASCAFFASMLRSSRK
jgi:zinc transport system permease protein